MPIYIVLFLIGFLNALPHNGGNLSIYFSECGFSKDLIGLFFLLSLPFSLKILWSCVIDYVPVPFFQESPRKGWFLIALIGLCLSFLGMSFFDPRTNLLLCGASLFCLSLFAGCLYMVGIAYELESIPKSSYSTGSACLITGYRSGLLYAGAGILYIAHIASWSSAFLLSAALSLFSAIVMLAVQEPYKSLENIAAKRLRLEKHKSLLSGILRETVLEPYKTFISTGNWQKILAVILLFKVSDQISKPMEGPFYLELGFDKQDLALAAKTFGFTATVGGAFLAARLIKNRDPFISCALFSLIHTISEASFLIHSSIGKSYPILYLTSGITNFTGGMLITAFISLLWKTCDSHYAPIQYAFLWSLSSIITTLLTCFGGVLAENLSWQQFFSTTLSIGLIASCTLMTIVLRTKAAGQFHGIRT